MGCFRFRNGWHGWTHDGGRRGTLFLCREDFTGDVRNRMIGWETAFGSSSKTLGGSLTVDEGTTLGVHLGFASLYVSTGRWRRAYRREVDAYLSWHFGFSATANLWTDSYDSSNPRQWRWSAWRLKNRILGKQKLSSEHLSAHNVDVMIPGDPTPYPCRVTLQRWTYSRPRWPRKTVIHHADVEVLSKGGIPYEGKGENAWDVGHDATWSLSCRAQTVGEAVGAMVATIVDRRLERGWELPVAEPVAVAAGGDA